jgi:predicted PolB exonuclease-like 3'-5' exonuclease
MNVADYFGNLLLSIKLLWHACRRIFVSEFLRHSCRKIVSVFNARWVGVADYFGNLLVLIKLFWHACRRIFVIEFLRHSCHKIVSVFNACWVIDKLCKSGIVEKVVKV